MLDKNQSQTEQSPQPETSSLIEEKQETTTIKAAMS